MDCVRLRTWYLSSCFERLTSPLSCILPYSGHGHHVHEISYTILGDLIQPSLTSFQLLPRPYPQLDHGRLLPAEREKLLFLVFDSQRSRIPVHCCSYLKLLPFNPQNHLCLLYRFSPAPPSWQEVNDTYLLLKIPPVPLVIIKSLVF